MGREPSTRLMRVIVDDAKEYPGYQVTILGEETEGIRPNSTQYLRAGIIIPDGGILWVLIRRITMKHRTSQVWIESVWAIEGKKQTTLHGLESAKVDGGQEILGLWRAYQNLEQGLPLKQSRGRRVGQRTDLTPEEWERTAAEMAELHGNKWSYGQIEKHYKGRYPASTIKNWIRDYRTRHKG
jgi:hypothetical protein